MQLSDICPVCDMKTDAEIPSVERHKMYFYFCSNQCRETFISHPGLYNTKVGKKRKEVLKQRTMHMDESLESDVTDLLIPYLKEMMGVKEVVVKENKIKISYDLLQVTEMQIEQALVEVGIRLGGGWLERLCRGWIQDSEKIELDNLAARPAPSCNRPPPKI